MALVAFDMLRELLDRFNDGLDDCYISRCRRLLHMAVVYDSYAMLIACDLT